MYNKLFSKILDSSIWLAPDPHRLVWITFLAAMDEDGNVLMASTANVAARARVTLEQAKDAILAFESPDPDSGDPDNEGRRIERFPGGWFVLNSAKYRAIVTKQVMREQNRVRVARYRAKVAESSAKVTPNNAEVMLSNAEPQKRNAEVMQSEAYTDTEAEREEPRALEKIDSDGKSELSRAVQISIALKSAGVNGCNPSHPELLALAESGCTAEQARAVAVECIAKGKHGLAYVIGAIAGRRRDAVAMAIPKHPQRVRFADLPDSAYGETTPNRFGPPEQNHA